MEPIRAAGADAGGWRRIGWRAARVRVDQSAGRATAVTAGFASLQQLALSTHGAPK